MAEDWSLVRSPSRARRRLKQGHRQNIRWVEDGLIVIDDYPPELTAAQWVRAVRHMLLRENIEALKTLSLEVTP